MNPVALLLGGGWKYLAAVAAAAGGWLWLTTAAYNRGVAHERAAWTVRSAAAAAEAATQAQARQAARDLALRDAAARAGRYAAIHARLTNEVIRYVATPGAAAACPDAAGVRLGAAAIDTANLALAAR